MERVRVELSECGRYLDTCTDARSGSKIRAGKVRCSCSVTTWVMDDSGIRLQR